MVQFSKCTKCLTHLQEPRLGAADVRDKVGPVEHHERLDRAASHRLAERTDCPCATLHRNPRWLGPSCWRIVYVVRSRTGHCHMFYRRPCNTTEVEEEVASESKPHGLHSLWLVKFRCMQLF